MVQAHVARASHLVLTLPDAQHASRIVEMARQLNAPLEVVIRARSGDEADLLRQAGLGAAFSPDDEVAQAMLRALKGKG